MSLMEIEHEARDKDYCEAEVGAGKQESMRIQEDT